MTSRTAILCRALAAWLVVTVALPLTAAAEYGLPAGASAVMSAGQPTLVRIAPGWDAAVAYEIGDGVPVTVWDAAQAGPDGSLWYPIDGGFVPAESVSSVATLDPGSQEAQDVATEAWVEPSAEVTEPAPEPAPVSVAADAAAPDSVTSDWIDSTTSSGYVDPVTGAWVEPATLVQETAAEASTGPDAQAGIVDPNTNTGAWVDSVTVAQETAPEAWVEPAEPAGFVDPNTGAWVEPAGFAPEAVTDAWIGPAPLEAPVEPAPEVTWVEPAPVVEEWVEPAPAETVVSEDGAWEPDAAYVELEQRGRDRDKNKDKHKNKNKGNNKDRGGNDGAASSSGQQIADFAMQYQGYPYVYAGEGPDAFDCSGFTLFVIRKTLGVDITHDMFTQYEMGREVNQGELQPGDLVFFKNTFRRGMSHTGIYIGGGEFVHAENESTGVVVSALNSDYYGERWYGAVRLSE